MTGFEPQPFEETALPAVPQLLSVTIFKRAIKLIVKLHNVKNFAVANTHNIILNNAWRNNGYIARKYALHNINNITLGTVIIHWGQIGTAVVVG